MDTKELCFLSATELSQLIRRKEVSPVEVVQAHLSRIETLEPILNSFITLLPDQAMAAARHAEREIQGGNYRGPLHGIPLGLKDLYYTKGVRTTSGSKIFHNFVPEYDCTIAARFKEAGAILLGKLNLHQLAYGPTGENPDYGHMHNPWNPELIAGGSSGGSGSATAARECTVTMGSDTGGSIRIPSALCNLVGLKPTYGRLSRYGLTPLSWCMDHPGPMVRTVEDTALVMNAISEYDPNDPASANVPVPDYTQALVPDMQGLRIGVPKEFFEVPIDPEVERVVRRAIDLLGELGATVTEVSWPLFHYSQAISTTILMAEAVAYHANLVRTKGDQLYPPVRLRLETGFFISAAEYLEAQRARVLFNRQSFELLQKVDALAGPMSPITACEIGATRVKVRDSDMSVITALTQYSRPFNINGFPAITVPCGFSEEGLPIGLQLAGKPFDEATILKVAYTYQQATELHKRSPAV